MFPVLFLTKAADFLAPWIHKITIGNYFKHLLMVDFRYFALNTEMWWRALQNGRIYLHQNPNG